MAQFIYYRDGDEEKGPFDEETVLGLYNALEFTSDVTFQFRSSETDETAPFIRLRDLIVKYGTLNPFHDEYTDIDERIGKAEKELAELQAIVSKKSDIVAQFEKVEERTNKFDNWIGDAKDLSEDGEDSDIERMKKEEEEAKKKKDKKKDKPLAKVSGAPLPVKKPTEKPFANIPAVKVEKFDMDNELHAFTYRNSLHVQFEKHPLLMCFSCSLVLPNFKQALLHTNRACPDYIPQDCKEKFQADFARWDEEEAARLSMGRRLFSAMSEKDKGSARPQPDFMEDINARLKKEMVINTEQGRTRAMAFLQSEAASKIRDRLEKHLREAKGKLVCTRCQVACKSALHFIIHTASYGHRLKVKGTSFELIALLLGWFNRDLYLNKADPSEMKENVEPDPTADLMMSSLRVSHHVAWTKPPEQEEKKEEQTPSLPSKLSDLPPAIVAELKAVTWDGLSQKAVTSCVCVDTCGTMHTNPKQMLIHLSSENHLENLNKLNVTRAKEGKDKLNHDDIFHIFHADIQKWKWSERATLAAGRKLYSGWSEEEKRQARPSEQYMRDHFKMSCLEIEVDSDRLGIETLDYAEEYFQSSKAKNLLDKMEKHLNQAKMLKCEPCKFGCKDARSLFLHYMTNDHLTTTQGLLIYSYPTMMIGVQKKDLYLSS